MMPSVIDCSNGDRINAVGITIEVALVTSVSTVAACEYKDRSFPAATVFDAIQHSFPDKEARSSHRFTVILGAPTATVN